MGQNLIYQLPFLAAVILLVVKVMISFKRGLVKEICAVISTIAASIVVLLIAFALRQYFNDSKIIFVTTLVLLFLFLVLYKILATFLTGLKLVAKLPGLNLVDKILGPVLGIVETVLIIWAVYCIAIIMDMGAFSTLMMNCARNNIVMRLLYQYNYMYVLIAPFSQTLRDYDLLGRLEDAVQ